MLTKKADRLVTTVYESCGANNEAIVFISEHDYNIIAAGSSWKGDYENNELKWDYDIDYVTTFSFGFKAYTYVQDTCYLSSPSGEHVSGYHDRSLRIEWIYRNGQFEVKNVYEYIAPGIINRMLDFLFNCH